MEDYLQRVGRIFPVSAESTVLFTLDSSACMPREYYRMDDPDIKAFLLKDVFPQTEGDSPGRKRFQTAGDLPGPGI